MAASSKFSLRAISSNGPLWYFPPEAYRGDPPVNTMDPSLRTVATSPQVATHRHGD